MRSLVEYLLANAAAATLLAVVAFVVGLMVRRPAVRNALWVLVLVRLLLPPVWTVPITVPAAELTDESPAVALANVDPIPAPAAPPAVNNWLADAADGPSAELLPPVPIPHVEPAASAEPPPPISVFTVAVGAWLAGFALVLVRASGRVARFRRALRDALPAPAVIQEQADELARAMGLRRSPQVCLVPGRVSPALWMPGLFAAPATLILPAGLLPLLDARQRAAVLAHELAHLRRGDPWVRWLELVVSGLYWWFPLVGWFRRELRAAEEECCDLRVVAALGERREYATALVETAAFLGDSGPVPALASGAGPVKHLQRRVTMIMRATWPARLTRFGLTVVLGVGGLGLAFGPALAQDRDEKRDPERKDRVKGDERKDGPARPREDDRGGYRKEREPGDREALERAREAVEKARRVAREAMEQLRAAEEALARAEGRPFPPREGNLRRDPADRRGDLPVPPSPPGVRPGTPAPPAPPGLSRFPEARPGGPAPAAELRELQMQMEELRRALEQMRQELRRQQGERGDRKDGEPRRERKDEPKRPGREPDRANFVGR